MVTTKTISFSVRIPSEVHEALKTAAAERDIELSAFVQEVLQNAVRESLPAAFRDQIDKEKQLYAEAQGFAKRLDAQGDFDENFTLTVFDAMMKHEPTKALYEFVIDAPFYTEGAPGKTPVNMYLGWYIKNAIDAEPLLDEQGKPRRAYLKGGRAIKSYTLLRRRP